MQYHSPTVHITTILPQAHLLALSNSWEESLRTTGSKWGGEDKDDSEYGL